MNVSGVSCGLIEAGGFVESSGGGSVRRGVRRVAAGCVSAGARGGARAGRGLARYRPPRARAPRSSAAGDALPRAPAARALTCPRSLHCTMATTKNEYQFVGADEAAGGRAADTPHSQQLIWNDQMLGRGGAGEARASLLLLASVDRGAADPLSAEPPQCVTPAAQHAGGEVPAHPPRCFRLKCQRSVVCSTYGLVTGYATLDIIRSKTGIVDVGSKSAKLKWDWASHIYRIHPDKWANITTKWIPDDGRRPLGRPRKRCREDLDNFYKDWPQMATDRERWKAMGEAFAQQWDNTG
ncbi:hypothetical protein B5X24_HaOG204519 [Helicoverpa armigera]|uniref:Uncharacterized protein n=1 Tax=Helicoverpa armigera TaxID=29058 RepID=A0A2W1BN70_HELAM|nr:hypothetical protein B5X24_HaOG204519 [Helicoverpa armigera]